MNKDNELNGWRLEEDTEIRETLMSDDGLVQLLSIPPDNRGPKLQPRWVMMIKILLSVSVIGVSFVLGVLFSQNTQLKDESSKLAEERAGLHKKTGLLVAAVDQCRSELSLCAEDVELLQGLSEYELTPKNRYGDGYLAIRDLEQKKAEIIETKGAIQTEIETAVQKIRKPAKKSKVFWTDLKQKISQKRKLERKLKRAEKELDQETAKLEQAYYKKTVKIRDVVAKKNDARRRTARDLGTLNTTDLAIHQSGGGGDGTASAVSGGPKPDANKQDLASVVP